jgi:hypothetical protein
MFTIQTLQHRYCTQQTLSQLIAGFTSVLDTSRGQHTCTNSMKTQSDKHPQPWVSSDASPKKHQYPAQPGVRSANLAKYFASKKPYV